MDPTSRPVPFGPILWLVALAASSASAADAVLDQNTLLARAARPPPASISYKEVRYSSLLTQPLVVSGQLAYLGPGRFDRAVEQPYREATSIRGRDVVVEREGQAPVRFSLQRAPALDSMLEIFGALLSGSGAVLERSFRVMASGDESAWRIELTPRSKSLSRWLDHIDIDGEDGTPRCVTFVEADGDRGVTLLGALSDRPLPSPLDPPALEAHCAAKPRS